MVKDSSLFCFINFMMIDVNQVTFRKCLCMPLARFPVHLLYIYVLSPWYKSALVSQVWQNLSLILVLWLHCGSWVIYPRPLSVKLIKLVVGIFKNNPKTHLNNKYNGVSNLAFLYLCCSQPCWWKCAWPRCNGCNKWSLLCCQALEKLWLLLWTGPMW